jgi:hypothetical protein
MMFYLKWKHRYIRSRGGAEKVKENRIRFSLAYNSNLWQEINTQKAKERYFLPFL